MPLVPCSPHKFQCNLPAQMMEEKSHQKEHAICFLTAFPSRSRDNPIQFHFPVANNPLQKKDTIEVGDGKLQKLQLYEGHAKVWGFTYMAGIAAGETFWAAGC